MQADQCGAATHGHKLTGKYKSRAHAQHVRRETRASPAGHSSTWRPNSCTWRLKAHAQAVRQARSAMGGRRTPLGIDRSKQEARHRSGFSNACVALAPVALLQNDHGHGPRQAARWRVHGQAEGAVLCRRAPLTRATQRAIRAALTCIGQLTLESQPAWVTQRGWLGEIINMRTPLQLTTKFFS